MVYNLKKMLLVFMLIAVLAGCGGGGSGPTPPNSFAVTSTTPVGNATGVAVNSAISVTFNRDILSVDETNFLVRDNNANSVKGKISLSARTATFTPTYTLPYNTTYTVTLLNTIKSVDGTSLAATYEWSFTTTNRNSDTVHPVYQDNDLNYVFDLSALPEITIEVSTAEWNKLLANYDKNPRNEEEVHADFVFNKNRVAERIDNIGFRLRGNTSRRRPETSTTHNAVSPQWNHSHFSLKFGKFQAKTRFHNLKTLYLKWFKDDPSYVREVYCFDLFKRFNAWSAPLTSYAKLYIKIKEDSKSAYFGVYRMIENVDEAFIEKRFAGNDKGDLWKCLWGADLTNSGLDWKIGIEEINPDNDSLSRRYPYDLKTNKATLNSVAKPALISFINGLNANEGDAFKNWIRNKLDVDLFLKTLAVNVITGMWDDYWVNSNNYYLYFDQSGKAYFIPYDYDNTLGTSSIVSNSGTQNVFNWGPMNSTRPLVYKILSIPEFREQYQANLIKLIDERNDLFNASSSIQRIQSWQTMISSQVSNDTGEDMAIIDRPAGWGNCSFYRLLSGGDSGGPGEANYFRTRIRFAKQQLGIGNEQ